jgi:SAM-dependent methyltransferase
MKTELPVKKFEDGKVMLNVGCGSRTHLGWNNIDFSPIIFFVRHPFLSKILRKIHFLSEDRLRRIQSIDTQIIHHNLSQGIPWKDETFDVIYHSHFLEHLDRISGINFLSECHRCLKNGGVLRIVIPDLYALIRYYNSTYSSLEKDNQATILSHEDSVYNLFSQMVNKELSAPTSQGGILGRIENLLRGNTVSAGEAHLWMYDQYTLEAILLRLGFKEIEIKTATTSRIFGWAEFGLDTNEDASIYKEDSLYVEAIK